MGNMQFVGHLYKAAMITEKIVHICIQDLLRDASSEEVECVCKLLVTAGPYLQVRSCFLYRVVVLSNPMQASPGLFVYSSPRSSDLSI